LRLHRDDHVLVTFDQVQQTGTDMPPYGFSLKAVRELIARTPMAMLLTGGKDGWITVVAARRAALYHHYSVSRFLI
jgi:hypothetical protein